jgi:phosphoribosylformimino-5-aminoimidazole carboxamide ribotide isomerase
VRLIGVIDLRGGHAVHARAGRREDYAAVKSVAGCVIEPGDPQALAHGYIDRLGLAELYVADLDAILHGGRDGPDASARLAGRSQSGMIITALATSGARLWLDAGVSSVVVARQALDLGAAHLVVGLETLSSFGALEEICGAAGGDRVAFSLDLFHGRPMLAMDGIPPGEPAEALATRAADAGAGAVIVLDLARVGTGAGLDLRLIERVRASVPRVTLIAGGGVRGLEDLRRLADAGADGALVATALLDGRIDAAGVSAAQGYRPTAR